MYEMRQMATEKLFVIVMPVVNYTITSRKKTRFCQ